MKMLSSSSELRSEAAIAEEAEKVFGRWGGNRPTFGVGISYPHPDFSSLGPTIMVEAVAYPSREGFPVTVEARFYLKSRRDGVVERVESFSTDPKVLGTFGSLEDAFRHIKALVEADELFR